VVEAVEVLAARAADLATAVRTTAYKAFVILDGTLLPIGIRMSGGQTSGRSRRAGSSASSPAAASATTVMSG
jgi:uncharacterized membrane protein YedE/YeeE